MQYTYKKVAEGRYEFVDEVMSKLETIFSVLKTTYRAKDIGEPELENLTMDKAIRDLYRKLKHSNLSRENKSRLEKIVEYFQKYFNSTFKTWSEISKLSTQELAKSEKYLNDPIVYQRDFHSFPEGADLVSAFVRRFPDGRATVHDLEQILPQYFGQITNIVNKCISLWKGIFQIDENTNEIVMNDEDFRSYLVLLNANSFKTQNEISQITDKIDNERGALYYALSECLPSKWSKYFSKKFTQYLNKPINEYPTLFSEKNVRELLGNNILTGLDFLKSSYYFLKDNTNLYKNEIINAKLGLAKRLKYDCLNFNIEIIHPSCAKGYSQRAIDLAKKDLCNFFDKPELTYKDILQESEVILPQGKSQVRKVCYRLIAFIRNFTTKCEKEDPSKFKPYSKNWDFLDDLKLSERKALNIKRVNNNNKGKVSSKTSDEEPSLQFENYNITDRGNQHTNLNSNNKNQETSNIKGDDNNKT